MYWTAPGYLKELNLRSDDLFSHVVMDLGCRKINPLEYLKYSEQGLQKTMAVRIALGTYNYYGILDYPDFTNYSIMDVYQDMFRYPAKYVEDYDVSQMKWRLYWNRFIFQYSRVDYQEPFCLEHDSFHCGYPDNLDGLEFLVKHECKLKSLPIPEWHGMPWVTTFSLKGDPPPTIFQVVPKLPYYDFTPTFNPNEYAF